MKRSIQALLVVLSILVGSVFIYSAYSKTLPIQSFEYTMVDFIHLPWVIAAVAARFFIGLEAGIGALIIFNLYGKKKWVVKMAIALIVIFSIYLIYLWATAGNNVNCGCFGDQIWMSPSVSLIKNVLLLVALWVVLKYNRGWAFKYNNQLTVILLFCLLLVPFIMYDLPDQRPQFLGRKKYMMDLNPLYATDKTDIPAADLSKGKHIVAFLSQSCQHCRKAAYKMHLMKQGDASLPFFLVIAGTSKLDDFWKETKATDIPYTRIDPEHFMKYTGGSFPYIVWLNNDTAVATATYITLEPNSINQWLNEGK